MAWITMPATSGALRAAGATEFAPPTPVRGLAHNRFFSLATESEDEQTMNEHRVFLVIRPNPTIFVHPLFPVFEPHIQKWVIFVRRRPCVCDTFRFESPPSSTEKKIEFWQPRQLNFPNVGGGAGQKQYSPCFLRRRRRPKPGDAFTRTRLMPTFGVSAERPVEVQSGCLGVQGV